MTARPLILVVEGTTDLVVLDKLLRHMKIYGYRSRVAGGKANILKQLESYNKAVKYTRWLVVLDLDRDDDCAPEHLRNILPTPNEGMILRIAVHSIEAWIMADRAMLARYLGVHSDNIPPHPDNLVDPKAELITLIERKCRRTWLRRDMLPTRTSGRKVGEQYTDRMSEFIQLHWRPAVAAGRSASLARCLNALEAL